MPCWRGRRGEEVDQLIIRAFIQARMSSARFPGKVLAPFKGRPLIAHVIARLGQGLPQNRIVVATSTAPSDDPLAGYVQGLGIQLFRGSLDNVVERLQGCLKDNPCAWFFRVCADSPLLDSDLFRTMAAYGDRSDLDLVTNVFPRSFPKGQSLEMLRAAPFEGLPLDRLTAEEEEHATKVYYNHPENFKIMNLQSADPSLAETSFVIDTVEDLLRLERADPDSSSRPEKMPSVAEKQL